MKINVLIKTDYHIIGKAWVALQKLNTIWNSNTPKNLKLAFFHTKVSSVLLYGSST